MSVLLREVKQHVLYLTLNRVAKHNAFDDVLLLELQAALANAQHAPEIYLIVLKANGPHFCAGADLQWMQRMAGTTIAENRADALLFANTLHALHTSSKPTLAIVQGKAWGGGAGLVAACDLALAGHSAQFRFSEVTLGLIPAVISPYVIGAIGARAANWYFMTAESMTASRAQELMLVQSTVADDLLATTAERLIHSLVSYPQDALHACKTLVRDISRRPLDPALITHTAELIAQIRASAAGQQGMQRFLENKQRP